MKVAGFNRKKAFLWIIIWSLEKWTSYFWWFRNPANQLVQVGSLSHYLRRVLASSQVVGNGISEASTVAQEDSPTSRGCLALSLPRLQRTVPWWYMEIAASVAWLARADLPVFFWGRSRVHWEHVSSHLIPHLSMGITRTFFWTCWDHPRRRSEQKICRFEVNHLSMK